MNFVAIDFETANHQPNSACSVAVVEVRDGKLHDAYYALIRPPEMKFQAINMQIHGITPSDVRDKPTFAEIWPDLHLCLQHKTVLAHNASFDMNVLRNCIGTYHLKPPEFQQYCTVAIARRVWPELENHKLGTLGAHFHIDFHHHNALDDARTCAAIALLAAQRMQAETMADLAQKLKLPDKFFAG